MDLTNEILLSPLHRHAFIKIKDFFHSWNDINFLYEQYFMISIYQIIELLYEKIFFKPT